MRPAYSSVYGFLVSHEMFFPIATRTSWFLTILGPATALGKGGKRKNLPHLGLMGRILLDATPPTSFGGGGHALAKEESTSGATKYKTVDRHRRYTGFIRLPAFIQRESNQ